MPDPAGRSINDRLAIVGAGIAGLSVAIRLAQHGIRSTIFERAPVLAEIGAGILLTPNASRALEALGCLNDLVARAFVTSAWLIRDPRGREILSMPATRWSAPGISLTRSVLQQTLLERATSHCHVEVLTGREVTAVVTDSNEIVFADGERCRARWVIGADGHRSVVRKDRRPQRFAGYTGWRALGPEVPDYVRRKVLSESWGNGMRFGISPVCGRQTYWYATINGPSPWQSPSERKAGLLDAFRRWHDPIPDLINATDASAILESPITDSPPGWPATHPRTALIGDAAHHLTPNLGQGAAMAIEDALVLADCLANDKDPLRAFARKRKTRKAIVSMLSRAAGSVIQQNHPATEAIRNLSLRALPRACSLLPVDWVYQPITGLQRA